MPAVADPPDPAVVNQAIETNLKLAYEGDPAGGRALGAGDAARVGR
jgi:hypothetical protein